MVKIVRHNGENDESFIRRFKRSVEKAGIMNEIRKREYYDPQAERKRRLQNARDRQKDAKKNIR